VNRDYHRNHENKVVAVNRRNLKIKVLAVRYNNRRNLKFMVRAEIVATLKSWLRKITAETLKQGCGSLPPQPYTPLGLKKCSANVTPAPVGDLVRGRGHP